MMNFTKLLNTIIIFLLPILFACNNGEENKLSEQALSLTQKPGNTQAHSYDCNNLNDKNVIYEIAKRIIEQHDDWPIWNLAEIDTTKYFTTEDYFTSATTKNRLVLIGGEAGLSAGSANNLLILFSCTDSLRIVWAEQTAEFTQEDITDINGDGIKEITCNPGGVWMGECFEQYEIFNFKDGKRNKIFAAHSSSLIGCGRDDLAESFKQGDTLENKYDCSLLKLYEKALVIRQIQTIKIYQGGETDEEIEKRLKVIVDTTEVRL